MKRFSLLLATLALVQVGLAQKVMIDKSFTVTKDGVLEVAVGDADVSIEEGTNDMVQVEVSLAASNMDRGEEYFKKQNFSVTQKGNTVRVETNREKTWDWRNWRGSSPEIHVHISVPVTFNADIHTSDGDIALGTLSGNVQIKTSDGNISAHTLSGPSVSFRTSDGDIFSESIESDVVTVHTSDGDVSLNSIATSELVARTSDGDIHLGHLRGNAELKTSDGDVNLDTAEGEHLFARTSDGDIRITSLELTGDAEIRTSDGDIHAKKLVSAMSTVHSSDGNIHLSQVEGGLSVTGSDTDVRLDLANPGDVSVASSSGDVVLMLPSGLGADITLDGDDILLPSDLGFEGSLEDGRAKGTINGGGSRMHVHASNGDVALRAR